MLTHTSGPRSPADGRTSAALRAGTGLLRRPASNSTRALRCCRIVVPSRRSLVTYPQARGIHQRGVRRCWRASPRSSPAAARASASASRRRSPPAGAKVVVTSEKPLAKCPDVQRLLSDYEHTRYIQADLLADGEPERLVAEAWAAFGGIDVLVNNLGTYKEPPLDADHPRPLRLHLPAERLGAGRAHARGGSPRACREARRAHPLQHVARTRLAASRCTPSTTRARAR